MAISLSSILPGIPAAAALVESYSPGLRRRVFDRLISRLFVCSGVPENHVVKRTFRLAWVEATRDLLKHALNVAETYSGNEFNAGLPEFARLLREELENEADRALDESRKRDLGESPIDAHFQAFISLLGKHLAIGLDSKELDDLGFGFTSVISDLTGWEPDHIPQIVKTLARDGYRVGKGASRDFPERVLDMLASFMQNPEKYPKSGPTLLAALTTFQNDELKELLANQREELAELTGDSQLANTLQKDLPEMERRLTEILVEIQKEIQRIRIGLSPEFGKQADPLSDGTFSLRSENTVVLAWYEDGGEWWEKCANHLRSALDRIGPGYELAPQAWDFNRFDLRTPQGRSHALTGMWAGFNQAKGPSHAASLVRIGMSLSEPIPCGGQFEDRLDELGLLADGDAGGRFFVADGMERKDRRRAIRSGQIPITLETRLILETWLAKRPLLVLHGLGNHPRETEVDTLLEWLNEVGIQAFGQEQIQHDDGWALPFVRDIFGIPASQIPNPYRRLDHYLPENAQQFFGRDRQTDEARRWLLTHRSILSISGPSGVGKSSFLNARVASLASEAGYEHLIFRPTDLPVGHVEGTPIRAFCEMLADRLDLGRVDHPLIVIADAERARAAALEWIERSLPQERRLFVAIDQFEEIVDNIANDLEADWWRALLSLLAELADSRAFPLAITLEDSRRAIYDTHMVGTVYHGACEISLADDDEDFARAIVSAPFADAGFILHDDVVERLLSEFHQHRESESDTGSAGASSLPLMALKLYSLFDHVCRTPVLAAKSAKRVFGEGGAAITLSDIEPFPLSITEEIKNLADQAWAETDGGTEADLGAFLRPFISVVPGEDGGDAQTGRLVLNSVPARPFYSTANRQAAFLQRRLIVPTPGGYRLTHQAVIHRWPFAAAWFRKEATSILRQGLLLQRAEEWDRNGRPDIQAATEEDVTLAASYLSLRAVDWAVLSPNLSDNERRERDFVMAVFATSDDADFAVDSSETGSRYIHIAANYGMIDQLHRMLDKAPDSVNLQRDDKRTPLANAAWNCHETVAFLLERNADPHLPDKAGFTSIDSAIWGGNDAVFGLLLGKTDPEKAPEQRMDPLYSAARCGRLDYILKLEQHGFRHDAPSLHNLDSLMGAAMGGDAAVFEYCLERCDVTRRSNQGLSAFDFSASNGHTGRMLSILQRPSGAFCLDKGPDGVGPLMRAAGALQPRAVDFLLKAGVNPNEQSEAEDSKGRAALHFALDWLARHGGPAPRFVADQTRDTLRTLLKSPKLDVGLADDKGKTAFEMTRHHAGIQALLAEHPNFAPAAIPAGTDTPLHSVIKSFAKAKGEKDVQAQSDRMARIKEMLADARYLDILFQPGAEHSVPVTELIKHGLGDDILALIDAGKIAPWPEAPGAAILPAAWQHQHAGLIRAATNPLPETVSLEQATSLAAVLSEVKAPNLMNAFDPEFSVLSTCIARCPDPRKARSIIMLRAAHMGNLALFDRMLAEGADPKETDDWGRDVMARASDYIRNNRADAIAGASAKAASSGKSASPPAPTPNYRSVLAAGDLSKIRKLLKSLPEGTFPDDWGRMPADFVPDTLQAAVLKLQKNGDNKGKGRSWRMFRK